MSVPASCSLGLGPGWFAGPRLVCRVISVFDIVLGIRLDPPVGVRRVQNGLRGRVFFK